MSRKITPPPSHRVEKFFGMCPEYNKKATVSAHYFGRYIAKTDLCPTYSLQGYSCNLAEKGQLPPCCFTSCPIPPQYL